MFYLIISIWSWAGYINVPRKSFSFRNVISETISLAYISWTPMRKRDWSPNGQNWTPPTTKCPLIREWHWRCPLRIQSRHGIPKRIFRLDSNHHWTENLFRRLNIITWNVWWTLSRFADTRVTNDYWTVGMTMKCAVKECMFVKLKRRTKTELSWLQLQRPNLERFNWRQPISFIVRDGCCESRLGPVARKPPDPDSFCWERVIFLWRVYWRFAWFIYCYCAIHNFSFCNVKKKKNRFEYVDIFLL